MRNRQIVLWVVILVLIGFAIWILLPNNPGLLGKEIQTRLGLDLVGGVQALLEADLPADTAVTAESMQTARTIVENRVNGLGVTEAVVQQAGNRRLIVELPGETDPEAALATIKQTGLLEFVDFSSLDQQTAIGLVDQAIQTDFGQAAEATSQGAETAQNPQDRVFNTVMTGADLKTVNVVTTQTGEPEVSFELTPNGAKIFNEFTSKNVGNILAIVLDKKVISAPRINQAITDGQGVIQGNFTIESANDLAVQLRYGSLPIPLKVVTSQTIGPTLGQDSLQKSLIAGIIGIVVVILYMALYYRLPGVVADIALLVYGLLSLAIFKFIPVTMTLPGIAGFILSVGVAVDANVLIFERLKEELRAGKPLHQAIDAGWKRAWPSIRDSNISTLITCAILFWFGSNFGASIVKGFSLTLAIGVGVSMFTAIVVTRTFLHLILDRINLAEHFRMFGVQEI
jgi:preprotein translocase subunit SecD